MLNERDTPTLVSSLKLVLTTLWSVLALIATGPLACAAFGREVTLVVDGQVSDVRVLYGTVAEVLSSQEVTLRDRDQVNPQLDTVVESGMTVTVRHARPVALTLNGAVGTLWTYGTTVADVVAQLGLSNTTVMMSYPVDTAIPIEGFDLSINTGFDVTVTANGSTQSVHAFGTVAAAIAALGIPWDADDIVSPPVTQSLTNGLAVTFVAVQTQTVTRNVDVPFPTTNTSDPNSPKGRVTIVTKGVPGVATETVIQTLHDGQVFSEQVVSSVTITQPVTQVTTTGTKVIVINVTPGSAQAIAYEMVHARGWDDGEFQCLVDLWNRESMWRVDAANPSGAYGIPQALPGSKMASAGADWATNPATQITWGLGYIAGRYGTPCGAWAAFQSKGWY